MLHKFSTYLDPMYLVIDTQFPSNKYGTYLVQDSIAQRLALAYTTENACLSINLQI